MKKVILLLAFSLTMAGNGFCGEAEDCVARGVEKCQKGDPDGGVAEFDKAIALKPDLAIAYYNRGKARASKGDPEGAMADENKTIELEPGFEFAYGVRAGLRRIRGDLEGALADLNKSIELDPNIAGAYQARGDVKYIKHDWDGAAQDYTKAIELLPGTVASYTYRGLARQYQGDDVSALADFTKALELSPDDPLRYLNRANLRYDQKSFKEALADLRKAGELGSSSDYLRFRIYLTRSCLGEEPAAAKELQTYLENRKNGKPGDWPATIARFLIGQLTEPEFLRAVEMSDGKPDKGRQCEAYFYAGTKRLISGDKITASGYFDKCLATGEQDFNEYQSAAAELRLLKLAK